MMHVDLVRYDYLLHIWAIESRTTRPCSLFVCVFLLVHSYLLSFTSCEV